MSATCRQHATMSADSSRHAMSTRHRMGADKAFLCRKLPTLCFFNEVCGPWWIGCGGERMRQRQQRRHQAEEWGEWRLYLILKIWYKQSSIYSSIFLLIYFYCTKPVTRPPYHQASCVPLPGGVAADPSRSLPLPHMTWMMMKLSWQTTGQLGLFTHRPTIAAHSHGHRRDTDCGRRGGADWRLERWLVNLLRRTGRDHWSLRRPPATRREELNFLVPTK